MLRFVLYWLWQEGFDFLQHDVQLIDEPFDVDSSMMMKLINDVNQEEIEVQYEGGKNFEMDRSLKLAQWQREREWQHWEQHKEKQDSNQQQDRHKPHQGQKKHRADSQGNKQQNLEQKQGEGLPKKDRPS